jgi:hypothetical protein
MAIFAVFRVQNPPKIADAVRREFPNDSFDLGNGEWLLSAARLTPKDISDKLGITSGDNGGAIVFGMSGYFGRAPTPAWDWIKAKAEASNG